MKKTIVTVLIILLNLFNTKANSDSLTVKIDSVYNTEVSEINDSIIEPHEECLNFEKKLAEEKCNSSLKKNGNIKLKTKLKAANWFSDVWDAFTDLFKPVWGLYTEDGYRQEGPYFLFDRKLDGPTYVQIQMQQVQEKIKLFPKSSEREIYKEIFNLAGTTTIDNCNGVIVPHPWDGSTMCGAAARAKASAFVYLVGLNGTGGALTNTEREGYRDRALAYLRDVKIQGLNKYLLNQ
ncbi:MAG: hypothetical protein ACEQSR_00510 [Candidatus Methylacidiphilales bacterium]